MITGVNLTTVPVILVVAVFVLPKPRMEKNRLKNKNEIVPFCHAQLTIVTYQALCQIKLYFRWCCFVQKE